MTTAAMPLALVIVTYNSADVIGDLLDSLEVGLDGIGEYEVIVVDNDSADGSAEIAQDHPSAPRVIRTGRNAGYAAAINIAGDTLAPDVGMLILNPDTRLLPGCARELVSRAEDPEAGVVVPLIYNADHTIATSLRREPSLPTSWAHVALGPNLAARLGVGEMIADKATYASGHPIDWATGAILLVTPVARKVVGRWDESFFLYSEEVDFQRRVRDAGLSVVYEPRSQCVHIGGAYMRSPQLNALMTSSQIRYFNRHHNAAERFAYRAALVAFGLARFWRSPAHRAALMTALTPLRPPHHYLSTVNRRHADQAIDALEERA